MNLRFICVVSYFDTFLYICQHLSYSKNVEEFMYYLTLVPVGFNPVQKLPAYEFLNKENKQCKSITHKTHMHRYFSLDPKTGTTSLIFHYVPFNVTICIYTCRSIQYHGLKTIAYNIMNWKPSCPKNMCENYAQNHRWVRPT